VPSVSVSVPAMAVAKQWVNILKKYTSYGLFSYPHVKLKVSFKSIFLIGYVYLNPIFSLPLGRDNGS